MSTEAKPGSLVPISQKGTTSILVSSRPPPQYRITPTLIDDCICDPVFAAEFFFREKLDEFQKCRLKICWWTPRFMDSSGFSSAKTRSLWILSNLRCLLIGDHVGGVYYQVFATGQKTYWAYFNEVASRSAWFRYNIGKPRIIGLDGKSDEEGKAALKGPSCWTCDYRNGSQIMMPAAGFLQDAKTQAGIRLNDLWIDEWTKIMAGGSDGIDGQLVGRVTRHCFNKEHPFWCNHMGFLATAEDTMHPAYSRFKTFDEEANQKGNPDYYVFSFSYKDYSDLPTRNGQSFKQVHREDKTLRDMRKNKSAGGFRQEGLGLWSVSGSGLYTGDMVARAYANGKERSVDPMVSRHEEKISDKIKLAKIHYFLGADPAKADTKKADDGSLVILRAEPRIENPTPKIEDWWLDFIWAFRVRRADASQWAAIIHRKHLQFAFTGICMDGGAGGGGNWIRPELAKRDHLIRGQLVRCRPIATEEDEATMITGDFNLAMFKRGDAKVGKLWADQNIRGDDNLIDNAHKDFWEAFHVGAVGLPARMADRDKASVEKWSEERRYANYLIELAAKQLIRVSYQTNPDGSTYYTSHQARSFSAKGRKDFAYAMLYAFVRFAMWAKSFDDNESDHVPEAHKDLCM
jgi:hypothetical protein